MLSDKELLKKEISTNKDDKELRMNKPPEDYSNPKQVIENAIRIARRDLPRRRRHDLKIGELYQPLGHQIALSALSHLSSCARFKEAVKDAFRKLSYIQ